MKIRLIHSICISILAVACLYTGYRLALAYVIEHNKAFAYSWINKVKEAENAYYEKYGKYGNLIDLSSVGLLEKEWTQASKRPYKFEVVVTEKGYEASVVPIDTDSPYIPYFLDESGIIKRDAK